jgi:FkbM family methyltransferase
MHYSETYKLWVPYEESEDGAVAEIIKDVPFLDVVMEYVKGFNTCIQAGGHVGIHPIKLSKYFRNVVTFEPSNKNFECLKKNLEGIPNVFAVNKGLSDKTGTLTFLQDEFPDGRRNSGAAFVKDAEYPEITEEFTQEVLTIDSLFKEEQVDFIQLDVEGHEYEVLKGGEETINRCSPLIMVESIIKKHQVVELLKTWGYYFILANSTDGVFKK